MNEIINEIKNTDNIVILCHTNPDGDAIGSSLGMYNALKSINKNVDIVISEAPKKFNYIDGFNEIKETSDKIYDLAIIVDTATYDRVNAPFNLLNTIKRKIIIDHHISNTKYGDINFVVDMPAAALVVYKLICEMGIEISKSIAEAICTGILTDTGGFAYGNITSEVFLIVSELSKLVDVPSIHKRALGTITKGQYDLKKMTMENLEFYFNNRVSYSSVTDEDLRKYGADRNDCNILLNIPREIEGVEVCVLFRKYDDYLRVSLRSVNIDLNEIAKVFGGGGHKQAAGITIKGEYDADEIKTKILKEIEVKLNEWDNSCK